MNYNGTMTKAHFVVGILRAAGYDAHIIGGALRVAALGGITNDVDIAVLVDGFNEGQLLNKDTGIVLRKLGYPFELMHSTPYTNTNGFVADWRFEDMNLIAYNSNVFSTVQDLVKSFDLNINGFYLNEDGFLQNDLFNSVSKQVIFNPFDATLTHDPIKARARVERFRKEYPELDWTAVDAMFNNSKGNLIL